MYLIPFEFCNTISWHCYLVAQLLCSSFFFSCRLEIFIPSVFFWSGHLFFWFIIIWGYVSLRSEPMEMVSIRLISAVDANNYNPFLWIVQHNGMN